MDKTNGGVAIGLCGGAARGFAHIGVLRALEEHQLAPTIIAGTSTGAVIGGMYAAGKTPRELAAIAASFGRNESRGLIDFSVLRGNIVSGDRIEEFLRKIVGDLRIENLERRFLATAVDIRSGRGYYFDRGDLVDAIRASISIPGVFAPVAANGGLLVDGGVRRNLPLTILNRYRPSTVVASRLKRKNAVSDEWRVGEIRRARPEQSANDPDLWERIKSHLPWNGGSEARATVQTVEGAAGENDVPGLREIIARAFTIITAEVTNEEIERALPDVLVNVDTGDVGSWEFSRTEELIEAGYRQAKATLEMYQSKRSVLVTFRRRIRRRRRERLTRRNAKGGNW